MYRSTRRAGYAHRGKHADRLFSGKDVRNFLLNNFIDVDTIKKDRGASLDMSILTVIAATLSLLWLYLGIITISNDRKNRINILFSILCFAMLLWNASGGIAYSISDITVFRWASRISFIGFFCFSRSTFNFI